MSILFPAETERIVFPVHRYDAICVRTALFYFRIKILRNLPIGKLTVKSDGDIEYQIGMCRSLHHAKIVHSNLRSRLFRKLSHDFARGNAHFVRLRIGKAYGIHMNDEVYPAIFKEICRKAGVPVQVFTNRADEPGGSTLGNLQSHTLPIPMADIGLAQLAMHSAVETAAVADADHMINAVAEFYRVHLRALGDGTYTLE